MVFTKGPSISLTYEQVEELVSQLGTEEKLHPAQKPDKELARKRLRGLFDEVRPKKPVAATEIVKVSKAVRKNVAARHRREAAAGSRSQQRICAIGPMAARGERVREVSRPV